MFEEFENKQRVLHEKKEKYMDEIKALHQENAYYKARYERLKKEREERTKTTDLENHFKNAIRPNSQNLEVDKLLANAVQNTERCLPYKNDMASKSIRHIEQGFEYKFRRESSFDRRIKELTAKDDSSTLDEISASAGSNDKSEIMNSLSDYSMSASEEASDSDPILRSVRQNYFRPHNYKNIPAANAVDMESLQVPSIESAASEEEEEQPGGRTRYSKTDFYKSFHASRETEELSGDPVELHLEVSGDAEKVVHDKINTTESQFYIPPFKGKAIQEPIGADEKVQNMNVEEVKMVQEDSKGSADSQNIQSDSDALERKPRTRYRHTDFYKSFNRDLNVTVSEPQTMPTDDISPKSIEMEATLTPQVLQLMYGDKGAV